MNFRFRKTKRILPGVKLNITDRGISANIGVKGASVGIGKRGSHLNVSAPGTGISGRQKIGGAPNMLPVLVGGAIGLVVLVAALALCFLTARR
jgi:hypothetical protein